MTANGLLIPLMGFMFLFLGYMGVPVAFALIGSVLLVTAFTPISQASMIAQVFNGMDVEVTPSRPARQSRVLDEVKLKPAARFLVFHCYDKFDADPLKSQNHDGGKGGYWEDQGYDWYAGI